MKPASQLSIGAELTRLRGEAGDRRLLWADDPVAAALDAAAERIERVIEEIRNPLKLVPPEEWIALRGLAVTPQSVRQWCRTGKLPARPGARGWEIPASAPVPDAVRIAR